MTQFFLPPKHVRTPELLIPSRKPVGPVEIDWTHPLARGVSTYVLFNSNDPHDLVTGRHLTVGGGPRYLVRYGAFFDEIDDYYTLPIKLSSEFSIVTHPQTNDNTGSNFQYILSFKSFGAANSFQLYINEASQVPANALNIYGGSATNTQLASYYPGLTDKCLVFNSAGGTGQIFVDGIEQTTSPSTFTAIADNTSDTLYISSRSDLNVDRFFGGTLKYLIIYNQRTLSDPEVRQLSADPYQILKPSGT